MNKLKTYQLNVYCRRNGVTQDAGIEASGKYKSDQEAIADLKPKVGRLFRYYDEVSWTITQDGRKVL